MAKSSGPHREAAVSSLAPLQAARSDAPRSEWRQPPEGTNQPFSLEITFGAHALLGNGALDINVTSHQVANGSYSMEGFGSGEFSLTVTPLGNFQLTLSLNGQLRSFLASVSLPPGSSNTMLLTNLNDSNTYLALSRHNGRWFADGQVDLKKGLALHSAED